MGIFWRIHYHPSIHPLSIPLILRGSQGGWSRSQLPLGERWGKPWPGRQSVTGYIIISLWNNRPFGGEKAYELLLPTSSHHALQKRVWMSVKSMKRLSWLLVSISVKSYVPVHIFVQQAAYFTLCPTALNICRCSEGQKKKKHQFFFKED